MFSKLPEEGARVEKIDVRFAGPSAPLRLTVGASGSSDGEEVLSDLNGKS